MAHQLESMFSVKETPWHNLGNVVREAPSAADAIVLAGLDWGVMESPIYAQWNGGSFEKVCTHKLLYRSTDKAHLGVVSNDFHPLQNITAFNFFDPFLKAGDASLETAGSLRNGKTVWVLAHINRGVIDIKNGDVVRKFFLLSNGHDGSMALRIGFTPIRVVCANTLNMAIGDNHSSLIRIMHTSKIKDNLEKVHELINMADAQFEATAEQYRALADRDIDASDLQKYVKLVFDFKPKAEESPEQKERRELREKSIVSDITRLFETGQGADLRSAKGTAWGLYNSVTEYLTYEKGRTNETRLNQLWFGDNKRVSKRAFEQAMNLVVA